jgi:hypothetical protein
MVVGVGTISFLAPAARLLAIQKAHLTYLFYSLTK